MTTCREMGTLSSARAWPAAMDTLAIKLQATATDVAMVRQQVYCEGMSTLPPTTS
jgi:hypothetical protein